MIARRAGTIFVLACCAWAMAVLLGGCASAPKPVPTLPASKESVPIILGFWIDGLGLHSERNTANVGVFVRPCGEVRLDDIHCLYAEMTNAPIVGTFRSSREAHVVARNLENTTGAQVIWVHATYNGNWILALETPPTKDRNHHQEQRAPEEAREYDEYVPIGEPNAGINGYQTAVYVLPPPLEQRGICLTRSHPYQRALQFVLPPDKYTSLFTSWEDTQEALRGVGEYWVIRWRDGKQTHDPRN